MTKKIVLMLASDPSDAARLALGKEVRELRTALQLSGHRDDFEFFDRSAVRARDISQAIHDTRPSIVHFSGHGGSDGVIYIEDDAGQSQRLEMSALGALFAITVGEIECVVFNNCYSAKQAVQIADVVPYVIGNSKAVFDDEAILFTSGFYKALGGNRSYREAFDFAISELRIHGSTKWRTPRLTINLPGQPKIAPRVQGTPSSFV